MCCVHSTPWPFFVAHAFQSFSGTTRNNKRKMSAIRYGVRAGQMHQPANSDRRFEAENLLALARQKSREGRSRLAALIVQLFDYPDQALNARERELIYRILHDVVRDIEMSTRRAIATHIAGRDDVPKDLILMLANDKIEIAYPVLVESGLLRDEDLIEIVRFRSIEHQLAVAARQGIGESVSAELVETGEENVIVALLKNKSAKIAGQTMEYLVEQSRRVDAYREPLLLRKEISPDVVKRMFIWVSMALREYIVANFAIDRHEIDNLMERVIAIEVGRLSEEKPLPRKKSQELAKAMDEEGLITPDLLISALREAEFPLVVAMFSRLTGLRDYLITRFMFEPGGEGLAIACKASGIGKMTFATIYSLAQQSPTAAADPSAGDLASVLRFFDSFSAAAAQDVMRQWQRGADYLNAIREFTAARTASVPRASD